LEGAKENEGSLQTETLKTWNQAWTQAQLVLGSNQTSMQEAGQSQAAVV